MGRFLSRAAPNFQDKSPGLKPLPRLLDAS
jgi:hypothetical protein